MDEFMPQALPVAFEKYRSDNCGNPATTAEEYLSRVRQEAKQCPDIVVAEVETGQNAPHKEFPQSEDQVESTLPWNTPSRKWQLAQSDEYAKVMLKLTLLKEHNAKEIKAKCPALPRMKDELGWCRFCFGADFHSKLVKAIAAAGEYVPRAFLNQDDEDDKNDDDDENNVPDDGVPRPPLVTILLNMDQPMIQQVLDYHVHWLQLVGFTIAQGCWIYALMACLAKPLLPDSAASIRTMARTCRKIRLTVESEEDERLSSLNLLIALVANHFQQGDLMDKG